MNPTSVLADLGSKPVSSGSTQRLAQNRNHKKSFTWFYATDPRVRDRWEQGIAGYRGELQICIL